jgi:hypothetical protein
MAHEDGHSPSPSDGPDLTDPPVRRRPLAAFGWVLGGFSVAWLVGGLLFWVTALGSTFLERTLGDSPVVWPPGVWEEQAWHKEVWDEGVRVESSEVPTEVVADYRAHLRTSWSSNVLLALLLGIGVPGYALLGWLHRQDFLREHPEHLDRGAEAAGETGRGPGLSAYQAATTGLLLGAGLGLLRMSSSSIFGEPAPSPISLEPRLFDLVATTPFGVSLALVVEVLAVPPARELFFRG